MQAHPVFLCGLDDHEPRYSPFGSDDWLLELRDGAHPGNVLHVTLQRLIQDTGLEGGFDQAGADHDVKAAFVVAQVCTGLELAGTRGIESHGMSVVTFKADMESRPLGHDVICHFGP